MPLYISLRSRDLVGCYRSLIDRRTDRQQSVVLPSLKFELSHAMMMMTIYVVTFPLPWTRSGMISRNSMTEPGHPCTIKSGSTILSKVSFIKRRSLWAWSWWWWWCCLHKQSETSPGSSLAVEQLWWNVLWVRRSLLWTVATSSTPSPLISSQICQESVLRRHSYYHSGCFFNCPSPLMTMQWKFYLGRGDMTVDCPSSSFWYLVTFAEEDLKNTLK